MPETKTVWVAWKEENTAWDEWEPVWATTDKDGEVDWTTNWAKADKWETREEVEAWVAENGGNWKPEEWED